MRTRQTAHQLQEMASNYNCRPAHISVPRCYCPSSHQSVGRTAAGSSRINNDLDTVSASASASLQQGGKERPPNSAAVTQVANNTRFRISALLWMSFLVFCLSSSSWVLFGDVYADANIEPTSYDWENWNFYKILGLEDQEDSAPTSSPPSRSEIKNRMRQRKSLDPKDVRKAYRKQAQLWHPDKYVHKMKQQKEQQSQQKENASKSNTISIEECNARFAKIAEAYQVLSDDNKRKEYEQYLERLESSGRDQHRRQSHANYDRYSDLYQNPSNYYDPYAYDGFTQPDARDEETWADMFDRVTTDPRKVFEEFFYGWFDDGGQEKSQQEERQRQKEENYRRQQRRNQVPVRTFEKEEFFDDPYTGEQLLRLLQKHEFPTDPESGQYYYRVEAQEFRRVGYHMYRGWQIEPVSKLYVVEEGYQSDHRYEQSSRTQKPQRQKRSEGRPTQKEKHADKPSSSKPSNIMMSGDVLTPRSTLLVSPNGRYYAGMSPQCELLVVLNNTAKYTHEENAEDEVVWGSETFAPHGSCFATLQSSRLIIALGEPHRPVQTLWVSDEDSNGSGFLSSLFSNDSSHHPLYTSESVISYQMQLDNDGSLTIYRVKTITRQFRSTVGNNSQAGKNTEENSDKPISKWKQIVTEYLEPLSSPPPKVPTRAARAWTFTRHWASDTILGSNYLSRENVGPEFGNGGASTITFKSCVFTTSPTGCNRAARRSRQLALDVGRFAQVQAGRAQGAADTVIDLLLDGGADDGTDLLDRIIKFGSSGVRKLQRRLEELRESQPC